MKIAESDVTPCMMCPPPAITEDGSRCQASAPMGRTPCPFQPQHAEFPPLVYTFGEASPMTRQSVYQQAGAS